MAISTKIHMWRIVGDQQGFTLIEMLIAVVILTIGLLGTAALTTGVVRGNLAAKNMTTATAIAQSCFVITRKLIGQLGPS